MLDFEDEISRFKPSLEVGAVEEAIKQEDLTDMNDLITEIIKAAKE